MSKMHLAEFIKSFINCENIVAT